MRRGGVPAIVVAVTLAACTAIDVKPVDTQQHRIVHVCIRENPKVIITDFLDVLQEGLQRHAITSEIFYQHAAAPAHCDYVMRYTARQTWDFSPYLSTADLWLDHKGSQIAHGSYRLRGGGGLSLTKWQGTKPKMDPVIDQLLTGRIDAKR